jgi:hypothetical protein
MHGGNGIQGEGAKSLWEYLTRDLVSSTMFLFFVFFFFLERQLHYMFQQDSAKRVMSLMHL